MSTPNTPLYTPPDPRILHSWSVTVNRTVKETAPETVNGQVLQVTRDVVKPVTTRMALRDLTRKERRAAELFIATRTAHYVKDHGLLLASELTNRLINTTGGVLTDKEKARIETLRERHAALDADLARSLNATPEAKASIQRELATVRTELINLNAINEAVYNQTAEAKAQGDLNNWLTYNLTLVEEAGRWQPFFKGETFEAREASQWAMEDAKDAFYEAALQKIVTYTFWYNRGVDTTEAFKLMEDEMEAQRVASEAARKAADDAAAAAKASEAAQVAEPTPTTVEATV